MAGWVYRRGPRWWGDFRSFADVGGGREPLVVQGEQYATTCRAMAEGLAEARAAELARERLRRTHGGPEGSWTLVDAARDLLVTLGRQRTRTAKTRTLRTIESLEYHSRRGLEILGRMPTGDGDRRPWPLRYLSELPVELGPAFHRALDSVVSDRTGKVLSSRTVHGVVTTLQRVFDHGVGRGRVRTGVLNPFAGLDIEVVNAETPHMEMTEAAAFLQAILDLEGGFTPGATLAITLALTGGRPAAGAGLTPENLDLHAGTIRYEDNQFRTLKGHRLHRERSVPLWRQLGLVLLAYAKERGLPPSGDLLLPPPRHGRLLSLRNIMDSAYLPAIELLEAAGDLQAADRLRGKRITPRCWRTTYASMRLQTIDRGEPVSLWTVAQELGHSSVSMLRERYGRYLDTRHRLPYVEYRLPDGSLPGEAHMRRLLGGAFVDEALRHWVLWLPGLRPERRAA